MQKLFAILLLILGLVAGPAFAQMVPGLSNSMFFSNERPSLTFLGFVTATGTAASQDYLLDIGNADSTRGVCLTIGSQRWTANTAAITSVTINGYSGAVLTDGVDTASIMSGNGNALISAIWCAAVPTGSGSVTINVTVNAAIASGGQNVGVYRLTGYSLSSRDVATVPRINSPSTSLSTQKQDALLGTILCNGILATATWNAPLATDYNTASSYGAGSGTAVTSGSTTVTSNTSPGTVVCTLVTASLGLR